MATTHMNHCCKSRRYVYRLQLVESSRMYDAVVFGATGFTGQRILRELVSQDRG